MWCIARRSRTPGVDQDYDGGETRKKIEKSFLGLGRPVFRSRFLFEQPSLHSYPPTWSYTRRWKNSFGSISRETIAVILDEVVRSSRKLLVIISPGINFFSFLLFNGIRSISSDVILIGYPPPTARKSFLGNCVPGYMKIFIAP